MVVIVVFTFVFSWYPIQIILVLKSLNMYEITTSSVMTQIISHVLAYTNSCINPILYAYLSENFPKAFRKVIYFCPPPMNVQSRPGGAAAGISNDAERQNGIEDTSSLSIQE
jgi:allatostatin A receptor